MSTICNFHCNTAKFAACLVAVACIATSLAAAPFRVGFISGSTHHVDEFSSIPLAFANSGWEFEKFMPSDTLSENDVGGMLVEALPNLDMVAVQPLAPDYFTQYPDEWKTFLGRGGMIVVTDANYPGKYTWTDMLGPEYRHPDGEGFSGWYPAWVDKFSPEPTIRSFPSKQVDGGILWYHYNMANAGKAWKPLLRCQRHKQPCAVMAEYGKGLVYLTNLRCPYSVFFENMRAAAELHRNGLELVAGQGQELTNALVNASITVKSLDAKAALNSNRFTANIEIVSATNSADKVGGAVRGSTVKDGVMFKFQFSNTVRGRAHVRMFLKDVKAGTEVVLIDREQTFDDVVELEMPRYRNMVSTMRRRTDIQFGFRLNPTPADKLVTPANKPVNSYWQAKVLDSTGRQVAGTPRPVPFCGTRSAFSLPVPRETPAGDYTLHFEIAGVGSAKRFIKEAKFKIVAPNETQVIIDQDNVLLRNGQPWFPLGMYHAQPQFWKEVHDLGIDLQQSMNWLDSSWPILGELKQPLLNENKHRWPENLASWARRFSKEPFACMTYVIDEPFDDLAWKWEACRKAIAEADPDHPTYSVLLYPASFKYQSEISDIIASDSYPINKDGFGDILDVPNRIDMMRKACGDNKPVFSVVQSFGHEPADKFRVMAYLSIVHGAKGILWYPWEEGEPAYGINTNEALKEELRKLILEIRALVPAILSGNAKQLMLSDGKIHAMACGNKATGLKLICVNPTGDTVDVNATKDLPAQIRTAIKGMPTTIKIPAMSVRVY